MDSNSTYSLFSEETDSSFSDKYNLFCDSDESRRKRKKKGGKSKKYKKALSNLLNAKKGKKSKNKSKKQTKREFQYRLIEKSADTALSTASDIAKMYAESKFFPTGHGK